MMKVLGTLAVLTFLVLVVLTGSPADDSLNPGKLFLAWRNPVDPSLDSATINAMYELQGNLVLALLLAVPAGVGGLLLLGLSGGKRR